ncbi:N-acetyltransferase [Litorimonas cladophorae]|uniref:N-acetyltransferase n=1 Tax=Litorimonas cladophorae TaxID=1220491 RepID=A0A918KVL4_9PROT|nr:GNAT family N-acetyltransferase [Litorimonas cladophorae]GGX75601.1 N-acetyltransferase [Litorimonas cladophorae]
MSDVQIKRADTPQDIADVRDIFIEYLNFVEAFLGQSLAFQNTDTEFADFPHTYDALFLASLGAEPVAACGIKPFNGKICELKRLYCRPAGRGHGLGRKLTEAAILAARKMGYTTMYLDTDHGLTHANSVYESIGFRDIEKYYDNPMDSRFMALDL